MMCTLVAGPILFNTRFARNYSWIVVASDVSDTATAWRGNFLRWIWSERCRSVKWKDELNWLFACNQICIHLPFIHWLLKPFVPESKCIWLRPLVMLIKWIAESQWYKINWNHIFSSVSTLMNKLQALNLMHRSVIGYLYLISVAFKDQSVSRVSRVPEWLWLYISSWSQFACIWTQDKKATFVWNFHIAAVAGLLNELAVYSLRLSYATRKDVVITSAVI